MEYVTDDNVTRYLAGRKQDNEKIAFEQEMAKAKVLDEEDQAIAIADAAVEQAPTEQKQDQVPDWELPDPQGEFGERPQMEPVIEGDELPSAGITDPDRVTPSMEETTFEAVNRLGKEVMTNAPKNITLGVVTGYKNAMDFIAPGALERSDNAFREAGAGEYVDFANSWFEDGVKNANTSDAVVQEMSQFIGGFATWQKSLGALPKVGTWTKAFISSQAAALFNLDPHIERMSNVMQELGVENDFVAWLADHEEESDLEGRLKNTVENAFMDSGAWAAFQLVKQTWWAGKMLKSQADKEGWDVTLRGKSEMREKGAVIFAEGNRLTNFDKTGSTWAAIKKENPGVPQSGKVTIYRATVGDEIRTNDFVAINRNIADQHLDNLRDRGESGKIISKEVDIGDLKLGNDATEFTYSPSGGGA